MGTDGLKVFAPAKVNLYLEITGKREDGFHNLYSLFVPVNWCDTLIFELTEKKSIEFKCSDLSLEGMENTVYRAAMKLWDSRKVNKGITIYLDKRVPYGAGLGSASSDGMNALKTLNRLWECGLNEEDLEAVGLEMGSDFPFFLYSRPCIVEGRGEKITPVSHRKKSISLLILKPRELSISTGEAYGLIAREGKYTNLTQRRKKMLQAFQTGNVEEFANSLWNGFEEALEPGYPLIGEMKKILSDAGALNSVLSGSGSAVCGIFADAEVLERGKLFLKSKNLQKYFDFHSSVI
jgi:4-diphosphocytidyl-2-C-methyl-D-erythritol kinase